jgi:hypothetical protein
MTNTILCYSTTDITKESCRKQNKYEQIDDTVQQCMYYSILHCSCVLQDFSNILTVEIEKICKGHDMTHQHS